MGKLRALAAVGFRALVLFGQDEQDFWIGKKAAGWLPFIER